MTKKIDQDKEAPKSAPKCPSKILQPEVAEKYTLKSIRPGKYNFHKFGTIDLRTMKLRKADELFEAGFGFLVLKPSKKEAEKE